MIKILYICILFCLLGCTQQMTDKHGYIKIELPLRQAEYKINLSEIVDSIQYIPLETKDECLIGGVDKLLLTNDSGYLIVDKEISSSVYLFDKDGKFLRKIGQRGAANHEYVAIEDVAYCDGFVYIWDCTGKKLLTFSTEGDFVSSLNIGYTAYSISVLDKDHLAFCCDYTPNHELEIEDKCPSLMIYNKKNKQIFPYLFFDSEMSSYAYLSTLNNLCNNNLYLPLNDTIYSVTNAGPEVKYVLHYANQYMENKNSYIEKTKTGHLSADDAITSYNEDYFPHLITHFACENVDVFFMRMCDFLYYGFYYSTTGTYIESSALKKNPIINDIDGIGTFFPRCSKDNMLYCIADPADIMDGISSQASGRNKEIMLNEESNPVVISYRLKGR